ncbi:Anaerobic dehydrogenases, typically selenocysteine-containing [Georgfuchsia toluolica]|uniref:Anaerobic dehydrogenases, typically selenocysteine-containing n=1 Tax=Georgfuchsia toluolica TaxID=424218 RepID=A0A916N1C8_9PROT|nr:DUF1302 family protein [Georgfuchsia toluolica]CAG4884783.1 Anaerobic dehydrogenases, typically selenocysteine-containing [Georgfuchsia toluolica]
MTSLSLRLCTTRAVILAVSAFCLTSTANAFQFETDPDWVVNFDNSIQYTMGWRAQGLDPNIGNHFAFATGDYKFPKKGDMVTNRVQDLIEFQGVYKQDMGFRISASIWKDFAYNDNVKQNPAISANMAAAGGQATAYKGNTYSNYTKRYFIEGGEFLDAFVYVNSNIGSKPVYAKAGRLSQYWGNAFFFPFSNIAYSQQPLDFVKAFSQPGSEVKELFLPRTQVLLSAELAPNLSVTGQYFFEYRPNRYPEAGTYLGFFDILFKGPNQAGPLGLGGITGNAGIVEPPNNNHNWGLKMNWSPEWLDGDLGFYYRQFDEVDPWLALVNPATGQLQSTINQKSKLFGISFEKTWGLISTGWELSHRSHTALNTAGLAPSNTGARGDITNLIGNAFVQLGKTPVWDTGILLAEFTYTRLNKVTDNANIYMGENFASCAGQSWKDGCSTKNSLAIAGLFEPQWMQVWPGIDLSAPMSLTYGVRGNPAYRASGFYGQGTEIYSIGVKATYKSKSTLGFSYNGYHWRQGPKGIDPFSGRNALAGFGGIGAVSLNDRGWFELQFKTSF